jgi:hypothetical protein
MQERIIHISQQDEPYRRLAEAVVEQAAQDYQDAMEYLYETPHGRKRDICIVEKLDLEEFFRGDWYQMLTGIDGELLIRWLRNNARESVKDRIRQQKGKRVE